LTRWTARLFGDARLFAPDGTWISTPTAISAIIGFLSTRHGFRANRNALVARIWPDQDSEQARHRLATSLWRLKKCSGPFAIPIKVSGEMLELDRNIWIDSKAFELRIATHQDTAPTNSHRLRRAVDSYAGAFLDGQDEDWVLIERERLFYLYLDGSLQLAQLEINNCNWSVAIAHARQVCMREPMREDAHRLLMQAYAASGNRGLALKQYRICADILRRELDVEPMEETTLLAAHLQARVSGGARITRNEDLQRAASVKSALIEGRNAVVAALAAFDSAIDLA
jgi:DNA-binding SARP family transcriptional activator